MIRVVGVDLVLAGNGMQLVAGDDGDGDRPGVQLEVSNENQGQAALVLEPHEARQLRDYLDAWLTDHERTPPD